MCISMSSPTPYGERAEAGLAFLREQQQSRLQPDTTLLVHKPQPGSLPAPASEAQGH